jgi:hypothetical protein
MTSIVHVLICQNASETPFVFDNNSGLCEFISLIAKKTLKEIQEAQVKPVFPDRNEDVDINDLKDYIDQPHFRYVRNILKIISGYAKHNNDKFHLHTVDMNCTISY